MRQSRSTLFSSSYQHLGTPMRWTLTKRRSVRHPSGPSDGCSAFQLPASRTHLCPSAAARLQNHPREVCNMEPSCNTEGVDIQNLRGKNEKWQRDIFVSSHRVVFFLMMRLGYVLRYVNLRASKNHHENTTKCVIAIQTVSPLREGRDPRFLDGFETPNHHTLDQGHARDIVLIIHNFGPCNPARPRMHGPEVPSLLLNVSSSLCNKVKLVKRIPFRLVSVAGRPSISGLGTWEREKRKKRSQAEWGWANQWF